jgi:hypothetical protein
MKIDVVVPFHRKDMSTVSWCFQGIKMNIDHARILAVCSKDCQKQVEEYGVVFIDEDTVVPTLTAASVPDKRWGWYFQQILKLGMADWVETEYYLVVDSDTVFLRSTPFFSKDEKPLYATGTEYHQPYFDVFEQLLGFKAQWNYSFTVHHMMYNKQLVLEMRSRFPEKPWYTNIVKLVKPQAPWFSISQFNEQDTYGHYIKQMHPEEVNLRKLKWINVAYQPTPELFQRLSKYFDFCSFHAFLREDRSLWQCIRNRFKLELRIAKAKCGLI